MGLKKIKTEKLSKPLEKKPKVRRKISEHQQVIAAFIMEKDVDKINWPREMKLATSLIKKYDFEFLMSMKGMIGLNSLAWFISEEGQKFINDIKKYQSASFRKTHIDLEESPVAEPVLVDKKPNSLKDFLNIFKPK